MSKDFCKKLTLAVYRVTELFPEGEPLKSQTRESANKILADFIHNQPEEGFQDIAIIRNLFDLAEIQGWVDSRNFLVLRREYDRIEKLIEEEPVASGKPVDKPRTTQERKERILWVLKEKKRIHLRDLIQNFPQVSKRTLIRDLEELYRAGKVLRIGNGRASSYNIKW